MSIALVVLLIVLGIILLLVEFLIIPGVTVAGISGFILMISGIVLAYIYLGIREGNIVLLITLLINVFSIVLFFRSKTWKKAGLKSEIKGKVNLIESDIHPGMIGKTISRLAPGGNAVFNDKIVEVHSQNGFIDQNKDIVITHIKDNKIFIKLK